MRPTRTPLHAFPDIVLHADELAVKRHPRYADAKAGDADAAEALVNAGAIKVYACASHPVLSGPAIERISKSKLEEVVVTNTIPLTAAAQAEPKIKVLSIAGLLGRTIQSIHEETSVSSLFV